MNIKITTKNNKPIAIISSKEPVLTDVQLAIVGDFTMYTSKPLKDFMYESNCGKDFFFVSSEDEAVERLAFV